MTNRIDTLLSRQKKNLTLDTVMFSIMVILATLGIIAMTIGA